MFAAKNGVGCDRENNLTPQPLSNKLERGDFVQDSFFT